jgi:hypothetical protein
MLLKTNEEMGEGGLAAHQASQIELGSILAPDLLFKSLQAVRSAC